MNSVSPFPVWSALLYFDIFRYPLREEELARFCHFDSLNRLEIRSALNLLIDEGLVFRHGDYYSLQQNPELVERRENGNARAVRKWDKARSIARMISKFPFVRAVWISGSLSKDFMDEHSDIDYFIVTKPGRLWLCRTFLMLFKKIILLNSHKHFCLNYFIDEKHLCVKEQNLFTATELLTLKPLTNEMLYASFLAENQWTKKFIPAYHSRPFEALYEHPKSKLQNFLEAFIEIFPNDKLDGFFMKLTKDYWKKKFKSMSAQFRNQQLQSEKHISRHHPQGYQHKVLNVYNDRLAKTPSWILSSEQYSEHVA